RDADLPPFPGAVSRLRLSAVAHDGRVAEALGGALSARARGPTLTQLLPLAGAHLLHHPDDQPCHLAPLWARPRRPALRPAGDGTLSRRPCAVGRRRSHGGGVCTHWPRAAAPRPRQARGHVHGPQVAGDASIWGGGMMRAKQEATPGAWPRRACLFSAQYP